MFPARYWAPRYWAPRYWAKVGETPPPPTGSVAVIMNQLRQQGIG
jgi:hypothetical protein